MLEVKQYRGATLARSGSESDFSPTNKAVITLQGIQYSTDNGKTWNDVNENKGSLLQGSKYTNDFGNVNSYTWLHNYDVVMALDDEPGRTFGNFKGEVGIDFDASNDAYAVFPYNAVKSYTDGKLAVTIPSTQTYKGDSFGNTANLMIGSLDEQEDGSYHVSFKNMCGVLQLKLKGDCDLSSITVSDKGGRMLCGTASISVDNFTDGISTDMISDGNSSITLNCDGVSLSSDEEKVFDIVVPVGAFENGLDLYVRTSTGELFRKSTTANNKISRNSIKKMPELTVVGTKELYLHNIAVDAYLSYMDKPSFDDARSHIDTHTELTYSKYLDKDNPNYYSITLPGDESTSYTVDFKDETKGQYVYANRTFTGNSYDFINMIPDHTYSYIVKNGSEVATEGKFITSGFVREVTIKDSWNYRDIGGWTGLYGKKIKYEWIYRGGSLNGKWKGGTSKTNKSNISNINNYDFSKESGQQIKDLGIKGELDLRSTYNEDKSGTDYSHALSLNQGNTGIDGWIFMRIKTSDIWDHPKTDPAVVKDVAWIIDQVVNKHNPIAFHCKSGADRTGAVAMVILGLLGVDPGDIARDYELTNFSHEQSVVTGKSEFRTRKASEGQVYGFYTNALKNITNGTMQERCYYYLNQQLKNSHLAINASDLDNFIKFMLGLSSYSHPSWATENGNSLESIYNHQ